MLYYSSLFDMRLMFAAPVAPLCVLFDGARRKKTCYASDERAMRKEVHARLCAPGDAAPSIIYLKIACCLPGLMPARPLVALRHD